MSAVLHKIKQPKIKIARQRKRSCYVIMDVRSDSDSGITGLLLYNLLTDSV